MNKIIVFFLLFIGAVTLHASNRTIYPLEEDWKFMKGELQMAYSRSYDDSHWEHVTVPHDWAIEGPFDLNEDIQFVQVKEDGEVEKKLRTGRTGALPVTGVGWYRKELQLPKEEQGKQVYLEFDGAMSNAKIYLNGSFVGEWPYGYASFSFNVSPYFIYGEKNVLAVRLENKPEMSRFYSGAGLYRPVRMICVEPIHVAQWGTYITTPECQDKMGQVCVKTNIQNTTGVVRMIKLVTEIHDKNGRCVATIGTIKKFAKDYEFNQSVDVKSPILWDLEHPTLYHVVSKVFVDGLICDTYQSSFGFRSIHFDKDKGFFLNHQPLKIKGVCLHHDLGPLGAAVNRRATERQLEIMKEMGCNAIRTAHNPSSRELLELCDSMGIMVQVEAFDEWRSGKCLNGYHTLFDEWAVKDLTALIHRDRNHPSVIMWSIGNELREQEMKDGGEIAGSLSAIVRREDPTRPVTAGFNNHNGAILNGLADAVDLVGFNYKNFDYEKKHHEHPNYILYGSETVSAVSSRGVYKMPMVDNWDPWYDDYQVSSYDMDYVPWGSAPDTEFKAQEDNPFLLGEFVWTGFDYLGEPSPYGQGSPSRSSYFGIVDLAGLKKDRFYLYQSQWSSKPVLHVLPHWTWPDRINQNVPVECYTNYPKAELFVNGISMGMKEKVKTDKFHRYRLIWDSVVYEPGEIKVIAYDKKGSPKDSCITKTAGNPSRLKLYPDRDTICANGKDLVFITIEILDKNGTLCPRDASLLFVHVTGNGRLKALCNGDATDLIPFSSKYMRSFNGKLLAIIEPTKKAGQIQVQVSGERLLTSVQTIISK